MKNKSNLPYLITVLLSVLSIISIIIIVCMDGGSDILSGFALLCLIGSVTLTYIACPIGLIFQFLHKEKTIFDKWLIGLNLTGIIIAFSILLFTVVAFPNKSKGEKDVRKQIKAEREILNKEYQPVLDYLATYKKNNGVYPISIDSIAPKSELFDKYEYHLAKDKKGYWLQVYSINAPIEYYYNDEHDNGYNFYKGDGHIDGAIDNDYYYQIDDKWHAVMLQYYTRHSKIIRGVKSEKDVDTWMKDNVDKFDSKQQSN